MASYCTSCGVTVPDGQESCSVCYGDPYHGTDGILLAQLEQQQAEQARAAAEEEAEWEAHYWQAEEGLAQ